MSKLRFTAPTIFALTVIVLIALAACSPAAVTPTKAPATAAASSADATAEATAAPVVASGWPDLKGMEIRVAVENAYPPYNYIDTNGDKIGWDYDTFNAICELLNCKATFVETAWDGMLASLGSGNAGFDVAADGITYTPERAQSVDFSQLYQAYDETLLIRDSETRFKTVADLQGMSDYTVGTQTGTTNEITANKLFPGHVKSFDDTFGAVVQSLIQGDIDAVVVDRPAAEGYITTQGGMKTLTESLAGVEGLAFAYPKGSKLIFPINAAMSALQASGKWDEMYTKWFKSSTPEQATEEPATEEATVEMTTEATMEATAEMTVEATMEATAAPTTAPTKEATMEVTTEATAEATP
ncbi:MAG: transporter substrate-binding domain-containing protein [Chloroflexota bacterium]